MGHEISVNDLPQGGERLNLSKLAKVRSMLLLVGGVGLIGSLILLVVKTGPFAYSWLYAFAYCFTLAVGGLFWVLLHHASNSGWGIAVRRIMEQLSMMIWVVAIFGVPLLFPGVQDALWDWINIHHQAQEVVAGDPGTYDSVKTVLKKHHDLHDALLYRKYAFLNIDLFHGVLPGWGLRFVLYFVLLGGGAYVLRNYSLRQDRTAEVQPTLSARRFSCGWLPVFAVCITFAAIDWLMALNYTWFSTMWGVYIFAGSALSAMAVVILTASLLKSGGYLKVVSAEHFHIKGKLMFAFVVFWAYITFSQFFLIWYANITEETAYYLIRNTGNWNIGAILVYIVCHFLIPFVLLLPAWVKRDPKYIAVMACWVLFAHALDLYMIIMPERGPSLIGEITVPGAFWGDILALGTFGCLFAYFFIGVLSRHSLYPCGDPRLQESLNINN